MNDDDVEVGLDDWKYFTCIPRLISAPQDCFHAIPFASQIWACELLHQSYWVSSLWTRGWNLTEKEEAKWLWFRKYFPFLRGRQKKGQSRLWWWECHVDGSPPDFMDSCITSCCFEKFPPEHNWLENRPRSKTQHSIEIFLQFLFFSFSYIFHTFPSQKNLPLSTTVLITDQDATICWIFKCCLKCFFSATFSLSLRFHLL